MMKLLNISKKLFFIFLMALAVTCVVACNQEEKTPTPEETPEEVKYVVTFDVDGAKTTAEVKEGEKAVKPVDPVKEGYIFLGWYLGAEELETLYDFEAIVTADVTLVAKFEEVKEPTPEPVKYVVTFDVDGAKTTAEVKEGEKAVKPLDPVKEGYIFLGWYLGAEELETLYDFETAVTANITLVAKFEEVKEPTQEPVKYVVTFDVDGAKTTAEVKEGEKAVKPADPVKEGYVFTSWYLGDALYDFETAVTANITLVAKFEEILEDNNEEKALEILNWAKEKVGYEAIDEVILPTTHPTLGGVITWSSNDEFLFDVENGLLDIVEFDTVAIVTCKVEYNDVIVEDTYDFTVIGYGLNDIANEFIKQIKGKYIFQDLNLKTSFDGYGGVNVTWGTDKPEILSSTGKFTQPYNDEDIVLTYTVTATDPYMTRTFKKSFIAEGLPMSQKITPVIEWIEKNVIVDGYIDQYTDFPEYIEDFDCTVSWQNPYGGKLTVDDIVGNPITSTGIYVDIVITINGESKTYDAYYKVKCSSFENDWEAIEFFVTEISKNTYNFTKWGYLPFVVNEKANTIVDILPYTYGRQRTGITKTSTEYVVIHDTANTSQGADAEAHRKYITNLNNNPDSTYISWHYTVDEHVAIQHVPLDEVAYHAGDGSHVFGDVYHNTAFGKEDCIGGGNRNGIGIESCVHAGSDYNDTMRLMAKLTAELLIQYNLGFDRIKQHWHFAGKDCPQVIRNTHRWELFIYLVQLEYFIKTQLPNVELEWTTLDSSKINNTGHIFVDSGELKYSVKATLNGESKVFGLSTKF